jgi:hypothetical protein
MLSHCGGSGSNSCLVMWDFVMDKKVALGQVFSENFGLFPLQIYIFHLLLHNHLHYHPRLAQ